MNSKSLFKILEKCQTEEEVKYEFARYFKYKIDTREQIDLYTPEILFEFKHDINMNNILARSKAIAQALYYIRRLKYGRSIRIPSARICIVDKNEALFIETEFGDDKEMQGYFILMPEQDSYEKILRALGIVN